LRTAAVVVVIAASLIVGAAGVAIGGDSQGPSNAAVAQYRPTHLKKVKHRRRPRRCERVRSHRPPHRFVFAHCSRRS
jgi:hypothetical protein